MVIRTRRIKVADVLNLLERTGGFFTAVFIKQNGERRVMNCRFLEAHTRARYINNGEHHTCLTVFDLKKQNFRQINLATTLEIRANGKIYQVEA